MNPHVDLERVRLAHKTLRAELLAERADDGHLVGELASSPAATAAAVSALVVAHRSDAGAALRPDTDQSAQLMGERIVQTDLSELLVESVHWLAQRQNQDGGWGDTADGPSNIASTMLARAAFRFTCVPAKYAGLTERADVYIAQQGGAAGLRQRFGKDKTLSAPILAICALAGLVPWRQVPRLAFELICLPQSWHHRLKLSVASYAMPAQVAVGLMKFHHDPPRDPLLRMVRRWARARSLAALERMQPHDGSFMEATPLTAFVVMGLSAIGLQDHPIVHRGIEFLLASVRADASWPVVTNLATWNTTLAINNLAIEPPPKTGWQHTPSPTHGDSHRPLWPAVSQHDDAQSDHQQRASDAADDAELLDQRCLDWLLACQHTEAPPVTGAKPGGWGWTDLSGTLPETDDTAGALLALAGWRRRAPRLRHGRVEQAARDGVDWLLDLQNSDGGWPMFAREWGSSPLDLSATDLTAHALRALAAWQKLWRDSQPDGLSRRAAATDGRITASLKWGIEFLKSQQRPDGSLIPLRFGNMHHALERNPVYGTARVLVMCAELELLDTEMAQRAARWMLAAQHASGGWGPPRTPSESSGSFQYGSNTWRAKDALARFCTVEETALAIDSLLPLVETDKAFGLAVEKGLSWLVDAIEQDRHRRPATIGLYFAKLWYDERLYPLVFASGALSRALHQFTREPIPAPVG